MDTRVRGYDERAFGRVTPAQAGVHSSRHGGKTVDTRFCAYDGRAWGGEPGRFGFRRGVRECVLPSSDRHAASRIAIGL